MDAYIIADPVCLCVPLIVNNFKHSCPLRKHKELTKLMELMPAIPVSVLSRLLKWNNHSFELLLYLRILISNWHQTRLLQNRCNRTILGLLFEKISK